MRFIECERGKRDDRLLLLVIGRAAPLVVAWLSTHVHIAGVSLLAVG